MPKMPSAHSSMRQNLRDAGCDAETIDRCAALMQKGCSEDALPLLRRHRRALLEAVKLEQRRIDRLDYLIFSIQKGTV